MNTNFEKLIETKHMLDWFSNEPFDEITSTIEEMFNKQSPGTKMLSFEVTSQPQWLTGGRKSDNDGSIILVRSGLACACKFTLQDHNECYHLNGILTWVGTNLDSEPITNMWLDLDGTLEEFGQKGMLKVRIYELDS
jgi:hypothetical protein